MAIRALVCDDDLPIRKMIQDLLEERGFEVVEATNGQEALDAIMREPLDLVVLDFLMPKLDGLQVIRSVRLDPARRNLPIILLSAISKSQILDEDKSIKPDAYVNKPFHPKKLAKLIDRLLAERNSKPHQVT
jgi:Response regulator containing CheY-like receiver, AAA-type ATPase, and DNA-binding domains